MPEVKTYRKKPVEIVAFEFDGENTIEVLKWMVGHNCVDVYSTSLDGKSSIHIPTLEGEVTASPGDFVIRGVEGEFYPCKPDIFRKTYDEVTRGDAPRRCGRPRSGDRSRGNKARTCRLPKGHTGRHLY